MLASRLSVSQSSIFGVRRVHHSYHWNREAFTKQVGDDNILTDKAVCSILSDINVVMRQLPTFYAKYVFIRFVNGKCQKRV